MRGALVSWERENLVSYRNIHVESAKGNATDPNDRGDRGSTVIPLSSYSSGRERLATRPLIFALILLSLDVVGRAFPISSVGVGVKESASLVAPNQSESRVANLPPCPNENSTWGSCGAGSPAGITYATTAQNWRYAAFFTNWVRKKLRRFRLHNQSKTLSRDSIPEAVFPDNTWENHKQPILINRSENFCCTTTRMVYFRFMLLQQ